MRRCAAGCGGALAAATTIAFAAGCAAAPAGDAGPGPGGPGGPGGRGAGSGTAVIGEPRTRPGGLVPGLDRGLRSWQWRIDEARLESPLGAVLASVAVPPPPGSVVDPETADRLARNGLRLLAVPRADLDRLRALLVLRSLQVETWHGEAVDWRPLSLATSATVAAMAGGEPEDAGRGAAVAVGGRVQRFPAGSFRLAVRAWTMRMEDGPHLQLELRVDHLEPVRDRGLLAGRARPTTRLVDGLDLELATPADVAWVIAPAMPDEPWPAPGTPLRADAAEGEPAARGTGAARTVGPPVLPVPTVGELLLARPGARAGGAEAGVRELLVLEPELPPVIFPRPAGDGPGAAAATEPAGAADGGAAAITSDAAVTAPGTGRRAGATLAGDPP